MLKKLTFFLIVSLLLPVLLQSSVYAVTITDDAGRCIEFSKPFKKIISLYGAHTENLYYLGAEKQVIGVSVNDTYPKQIKVKPAFSYHDDAEKFLGAGPDLIIIRPMIDRGYYKLVEALEKFGIVVISLQPSSIDGMYKYWEKLGVLTGKNREAEKMVNDFKGQIQYLQSLSANIKIKKNVYFEAIHKKMKTFTINSMPGFVLKTAGGNNIAFNAKASRGTNIANFGKEQILSHAAEIDVFLAQKGVMNNITKTMIKKEPGFMAIKAVAEDQIYLIDEEIISRPGFRLLLGIKTIGKILYPETYKVLTIN